MKKPLVPAGAEVPCSTGVLGSGGHRGAETPTSPSPGETAQSLCLPRAQSEHILSPSLSESHREPRHPRRSHCVLSQTSHCKQPPLPTSDGKGSELEPEPELLKVLGEKHRSFRLLTAQCSEEGCITPAPSAQTRGNGSLDGTRPGAPASACLPPRWLSGGRAPRTHPSTDPRAVWFGSRSVISAH